MFEDKSTGIMFGAPGGQAPERDKNVSWLNRAWGWQSKLAWLYSGGRKDYMRLDACACRASSRSGWCPSRRGLWSQVMRATAYAWAWGPSTRRNSGVKRA